MSVPATTFYPLYLNPHHVPSQTVHVTRSSIDQLDLNSDDEEAEGELQLPYERDEEGEKLLLQLLGAQFQAQARDVDVDMDYEVSSSKKRKVEDEESLHEKPTDEQEEVFEFRLLSSSKPNKKIALHPPASALYVPNPRDAPVSDEKLVLDRARIEASCVDAAWVVSQSRLRNDALPSKPPQAYHLSVSAIASTSALPSFLVTALARKPSTNPFSRHLAPEPAEERGPGGHLPCAQFDVERLVASSSSSTPSPSAPYKRPEWFSLPVHPPQASSSSASSPAKKKKKKTRPPPKSKNATPAPSTSLSSPSHPMFYLPPPTTPAAPVGLGGKSRGYGWGYGAGREELWGAEQRGWVRDRMREGWVGGGRGEGWWGKGGKVWGETQR